MRKIDWISKLTSRKFWTAVATFVSMLIVALGGAEQTATQVTAIIMAGAAVVAYIIGEGLVDGRRTQKPHRPFGAAGIWRRSRKRNRLNPNRCRWILTRTGMTESKSKAAGQSLAGCPVFGKGGWTWQAKAHVSGRIWTR